MDSGGAAISAETVMVSRLSLSKDEFVCLSVSLPPPNHMQTRKDAVYVHMCKYTYIYVYIYRHVHVQTSE